jgi:predicted acylesterase/phospholipase RssA
MPKLGLVLSGGSIRGVAHIGMLKALEEHDLLDDIQVVVGTSAGSIVGSMFAFGYSPDQIWEIWSKDVWRMFGGKVNANAIKDWNWSGFWDALFHLDYKRFRGALKGDKMLKALECYLTKDDPCTNIRPSRRALPFYAVSTDFNTNQETVWCFTRHIAPAEREAAGGQLEPAPGKRGYWEVRQDYDPEIAEFPSMARVCRCSASIPFIFVPATAPITCRDGQVIDNLNTDGGVRDNYSLSTAVRLSECDRVIGMFLESIEVTSKPWNGLFDLAMRTLDEMGQTIFEADQDDEVLRVTDIRTLVPRFPGSIGTFDVQDMGVIYKAGHLVTEHFLKAVKDTTGELTWDAIFKTTKFKSVPGGASLKGAQSRAARLDAPNNERRTPPEVKYYIYREMANGTQV